MNKPRILILPVLLLAFVLAGCGNPPATQVYIVVTATEDSVSIIQDAALATESAEPVATATPVEGTLESPAVIGDATPAMPTPFLTQIQVAEQTFENGRVFWLQPTDEIWVMVNDTGETDAGSWMIYDNAFVEGDVEFDPELVPPADLYQPVRGFGVLWRENESLQEALGWGTTPEFGFVSNYEYRAGGYLDSDGNYIPGPGVHVLGSLGNELFAFEEADNTWRKLD